MIVSTSDYVMQQVVLEGYDKAPTLATEYHRKWIELRERKLAEYEDALRVLIEEAIHAIRS